jgi:long-chain acyl-CoA synthetase
MASRCVGAGCPGFVFKPIQKLLGGQLKLFCTGSAPLAVRTQKFVSSVFNCPVRQGYGLTETCAAVQLITDQTVTPSSGRRRSARPQH